MGRSFGWRLIVATFVVLFTANPALAQERPSSLVGIVVDPDGTAIAGAGIRVVRPTADGANESPLASDVTTDSA